jgi:hypothetical protein
MRSATYEIVGCSGSQRYQMRNEFDNIKDARADARRLNGEVADGCGQSFREYKRQQENREGWTVAGKFGFDGVAV